jgi:hypothetical protein
MVNRIGSGRSRLLYVCWYACASRDTSKNHRINVSIKIAFILESDFTCNIRNSGKEIGLDVRKNE